MKKCLKKGRFQPFLARFWREIEAVLDTSRSGTGGQVRKNPSLPVSDRAILREPKVLLLPISGLPVKPADTD
jgi:hypothetical protein